LRGSPPTYVLPLPGERRVYTHCGVGGAVQE